MSKLPVPNIDLGMNKRNFILQISLIMEGMTSAFIGGLLGIKNIEGSRTLGHKGSSLSFKNKIDLLMDIGAIDGQLFNKFQVFMEIRNKFAHVMGATTYEDCLALTDKTDWILKQYPQEPTLSKEQQLQSAVVALASEVFTAAMNVMEAVKVKIERDAKAETTGMAYEAVHKAIPQLKEALNNSIEALAKKHNDCIPVSVLGKLGNTVSSSMYKLWKHNFEVIIQEEKDRTNSTAKGAEELLAEHGVKAGRVEKLKVSQKPEPKANAKQSAGKARNSGEKVKSSKKKPE